MNIQCSPFIKNLNYILTFLLLKKNQKKNNISSAVVVRAFHSRYPKANAIQWQQIEVSRWAVNFTLQNKWYSALFDSYGNWLDSMTLISIESIPKNVQERFEKRFLKSGIKSIHKIETPNNTIYEIKWTNGIFMWRLLYDISGKMVGKLIS